jgi:hypothetical protein
VFLIRSPLLESITRRAKKSKKKTLRKTPQKKLQRIKRSQDVGERARARRKQRSLKKMEQMVKQKI